MMRSSVLRWSSTALSVLAIASLGSLGACAAPDADEDEAAVDESEDELKACKKSNLDWERDVFEDFSSWDESRWTKRDGIVVPDSSTCLSASNVEVKGGM